MIPGIDTKEAARFSLPLAPQIDEQVYLSNQAKYFLDSVRERGLPPTSRERSFQDIRIGRTVLTKLGMAYASENGNLTSSLITATHQPIQGHRSIEAFRLIPSQNLWLHSEAGPTTSSQQYMENEDMVEEMEQLCDEYDTRELDLLKDYPPTAGKLLLALEKDLGGSSRNKTESDTYQTDLTVVNSHDGYATTRFISINETRTSGLTSRKLAVCALMQLSQDADVWQEISLNDEIHPRTGDIVKQDLRLTLSSQELSQLELSFYAHSSEYAKASAAIDTLNGSYQELDRYTFLSAA